MLTDLREICAQYSTDEFEVTVFHPFFIFIDQYLKIFPSTLQTTFGTAGIMIVVCLILLPDWRCAVCVTLSIISIEIGVIGYMTWWGVRLDGVALINLIMCIGFSVDFSAHICYHYLTASSKDDLGYAMLAEDRIKASLYALGIPILQGAFSTILGVLGLAFAPSYIFVTFFKMIFLVIMLGAFHGMILLPVLLSIMGPGSCSSQAGSSHADTRGSVSKSTRSSGLSTPTLNAISYRDMKTAAAATASNDQGSLQSYHHHGYTMHNLGYVTTEASNEPSQFVPYQYHQFLQQRQQNYAMQVQVAQQPQTHETIIRY